MVQAPFGYWLNVQPNIACRKWLGVAILRKRIDIELVIVNNRITGRMEFFSKKRKNTTFITTN